MLSLRLGLSLAGSQSAAPAAITVNTPPSFNTALLYIGQTIGAARVAGSYSSALGTPSEGTITYTVNGVSQSGSYVIQAGDTVVASVVQLKLDGTPIAQYASTGSVAIPALVITIDTPPDFNAASLIVGNTLGSAYEAGGYTGSHGTITEGTFLFDVDGVSQDGTYVITTDDIAISAPLIPLLIDGLPSGQYASVDATQVTNTAPVAAPVTMTFTVAPGAGDVTAPTLTGPTATQTGATTANAGVTTDEDNGTLYMVFTLSATPPTATQVKAGQNNSGSAAAKAINVAVTSTGSKTFGATGLTASTTYYAYFMHEDFAGNKSSVAAASAITTAAGDVTAPVLTSPTATATGQTTATGTVTTDEGNGTLYAVTTTSGTAPTKAQVKAGQNNSGVAARWSGSQSVSSTGVKNITATGLLANTTYYHHFMHEDAVGNQSTVSTSASLTTDAAPAGVEIVGWASAVGTGATISVDLTSLTAVGGGAGGALATGDCIYVVNATADASDTNLGPGGSYTELCDLYQSDTRSVNMDVSRLVVSGSPPSTISCVGTNNAGRGGGAIAVVVRGQHATPEDVTTATAVGANSDAADPPSITPANAGTLLLFFMAGTRAPNIGTTATNPTGTTGIQTIFGNGTSRGIAINVAYKDDWVSGAFDAPAITGSPNTTSDSWAAAVVAVRKA